MSQSEYANYITRRVSRSTAPPPRQDTAAVPNEPETIEVGSSQFAQTLDQLKAQGRIVQAIDVIGISLYRLTVTSN